MGFSLLMFNLAVEPNKAVRGEGSFQHSGYLLCVILFLSLVVQRLVQAFNKRSVKGRKQRYKSALRK